MRLKKCIVVISFPLLLSSFLFSQSLAEVAKKEKERRAKLKGKKATVITNADLGKVKIKPAMSTDRIAAPPSTTTPPDKSSGIDTAEPTGRSSTAQQDRNIDSREPEQTPVEEVEAQYYKAREYTQLLTVKLRGLWSEFYSMDDMSDRGGIQKQIAETSRQIQEAQKAELIAKQELEKVQKRVRRKTP